jgi:hypothetical protein
MKTKLAIVAVLGMLTGCETLKSIAPDVKQTRVEGIATGQLAGDMTYSVRGKKKPNAILCRAGFYAPSRGHWQNLEIVYVVEHFSLCNTHRDRGEERAGVGLIWRPFAK